MRPDLRLERPDLRLDLRPERPNLRSERPNRPDQGGGTDERTNERMDGRTNESPPVFYRTLSPSGPLPCFPSHKFTIMQSRATGIADHIHVLPLGDLFSLKLISGYISIV